jgi:glycosyltransferase involved in cell wall biosynthesis
MARIVMLLSNPYRPDPRVQKEADSLAGAGYNITLICWDRRSEMPAETVLANGVRVVRIQSVRTVYGAGLKQILYAPRFWLAAVQKAMPLQPDIVYCRDLDTLYAGIRLKKRLQCKLVFDAHEDYPSWISLYVPGLFVHLLSYLQRRWLRSVDAALAASSVTAEKLVASGVSPTIHIPNVQDLSPYENIGQAELAQARQKLGLDPEGFVVSYIGGFSRNRLLLPLIEAMRNLPDATLLLAGDGHQRADIEAAIQGMANVHYLGWLPAEQVPLYTCLSDVIYYCLKPDYPGAAFNAPNTLSNAMAAGRPIIANDLGDLGRVVQKTGCGVLLEEVTPETIAGAIRQLRDPELRRKQGEAGHTAAQAEYNWPVVQQRLINLFASLLR